MNKNSKVLLFMLLFLACKQNVTIMKTPENASKLFSAFIAKKKFIEEAYPNFYLGIADECMRSVITEKINQVALDFEKISNSDQPTNEKYQEAIRKGLLKFLGVYLDLDTEDREKVCMYFEELMDIIELESSNGQLNQFMYGFDLKEKEK